MIGSGTEPRVWQPSFEALQPLRVSLTRRNGDTELVPCLCDFPELSSLGVGRVFLLMGGSHTTHAWRGKQRAQPRLGSSPGQLPCPQQRGLSWVLAPRRQEGRVLGRCVSCSLRGWHLGTPMHVRVRIHEPCAEDVCTPSRIQGAATSPRCLPLSAVDEPCLGSVRRTPAARGSWSSRGGNSALPLVQGPPEPPLPPLKVSHVQVDGLPGKLCKP